MSEEPSIEQQYPSVDLAYPIAVTSYDVALKRLEAMDSRLQTITAFVVTLTAFSLSVFRDIPYNVWFALAAVSFVISLVIGVGARFKGEIALLKPSNLYEGWLHKTDWEFKKDLIYHAGNDFNHNMANAEKKWYASITVIGFFALQVAFQTAWVLSASRS